MNVNAITVWNYTNMWSYIFNRVHRTFSSDTTLKAQRCHLTTNNNKMYNKTICE